MKLALNILKYVFLTSGTEPVFTSIFVQCSNAVKDAPPVKNIKPGIKGRVVTRKKKLSFTRVINPSESISISRSLRRALPFVT